MHHPLPITQELLLIGGGHTHALVLRLWGMNPLPGVRVTVINPAATAAYSGMLPGFVAGHYRRDELDIDLVRLARFAGARLVRGRAMHLDVAGKTVTLECGRVLPYDIVAIDIGITSEMPRLSGFDAHGIPAKPLDHFASAWDRFRTGCRADKTAPRAAIIGGGVAGVELALAMQHALKSDGWPDPSVTLIEQQDILPGMARSRLAFFRKRLKDLGVTLLENTDVTGLLSGRITLNDAPDIASDFTVGTAGARPQGWLQDSDLELHQGYVSVDETLRALNQSAVFAVGDCAHLSHAPRPKAGVFAVREAPVLFANLRACLSGGGMQGFQPQNDYLKLISLGGKTALADKWGVMFRGPMLWRLKDRIDRKFMDQFRGLSPMNAPDLPDLVATGVAEIMDGVPPCGGCGAKIGASVLSHSLTDLPQLDRDDILAGAGDDAAVLTGAKGGFQVISTDHLRAFTNDPGLMAQIAALHALGDIWAMGATPQAALANITLPRLSPRLQQSWLQEIMAAAAAVFGDAGAAIVGGHSATGPELSIGFTVTGTRSANPIRKSGARPGDCLILTKALGSGVVLAADMALKAHGDWVMAAYDSMARSQGDAANILSGAHAMTDVTGFGLAGHMAEIAAASNVGFELRLADIPLLPGALKLAQAGVRSSLFMQNRAMWSGAELPDDPRCDLLFDPQTSGGLLAAVSPENCDALLNRIKRSGHSANVIGRCLKDQSIRRIV